ncbi:hypothetical protein FNV43_RR16197 [Rhamnella rubrinervis]|uniref:Exopolygalacturonase n=1 Tax=Rhamnella rubrinervis TaxID=2594499 RepID=A0A8K0E4W7_9ROSA|nr:hypothetical protein FNV43_RR16197 [Rhamnella rubrinervis]
MAGFTLCFGGLLLLMFLFLWASKAEGYGPRLFNVMNYGAVADGQRDNSQALLRAWRDGCEWDGKAEVLIPYGTYMSDPVEFSGPCRGPINFVIRGILKAPTHNSKIFTTKWISFQYIDQLTITGGGTLDGQGASSWGFNDCNTNSNCPTLPTSLVLDFVTNSRVHHLTSLNSKNTHISIFASNNFNVSHVRISAPDDSPNTDGIKIGTSHRIRVSRSVIETGDDCIAMLSGSTKIHISKVYCGPGHGISIGSLGRSQGERDVKGIIVKNSTFSRTTNGVRIKTWASPASMKASNFIFQDIVMKDVFNPITIDQHYCPHGNCNPQISSNVQISNVLYKNIVGTSSSMVAVSLVCSQSKPCNNVVLDNINLVHTGKEAAISSCYHVNGLSYGHQNPVSCI